MVNIESAARPSVGMFGLLARHTESIHRCAAPSNSTIGIPRVENVELTTEYSRVVAHADECDSHAWLIFFIAEVVQQLKRGPAHAIRRIGVIHYDSGIDQQLINLQICVVRDLEIPSVRSFGIQIFGVPAKPLLKIPAI